MAEEISDIIDQIDEETSLYVELDELEDNPSLVAFWLKAKQLFATLIRSIQVMFETHKKEVEELIDQTEAGLVDWYHQKCLEYQHGDSLVIQNNRPVYNEVNEDLKIIQRAALSETEDVSGYITLQVRVVKDDAGVYVPLTDTELSSFSAYLTRQKIAGTKLNIQSDPADVLNLTANIELDPTIYNEDGQLILDPSIEPVLVTINQHLRDFDFGGTFYTSRLIDKIMDIEGVNDFDITFKTLNDVSFTNKVESPAGHIALDPESTLNYVLL